MTTKNCIDVCSGIIITGKCYRHVAIALLLNAVCINVNEMIRHKVGSYVLKCDHFKCSKTINYNIANFIANRNQRTIGFIVCACEQFHLCFYCTLLIGSSCIGLYIIIFSVLHLSFITYYYFTAA